MMRFFFQIIFLLLLSKSFLIESYQVDNKWYCKNQIDCLPWKNEMNQHVDRIYVSQNLCRLMCGKFGSLWPRPTVACELQKSTTDINTNLIRFEYPNINDESLRDFYDQIISLFLKNLNDECGNMCNKLSENEMIVQISVSNLSLALNSETSEAYQLNVTTTENHIFAKISAKTVFGVRHGLETLSQLTTKVLDDNNCAGIVMISNAFISDKPVYQHRGLLIDSARHFIPMKTILKILDGMAINKMNVFHWHITDSQSFPMETKRIPQMFQNGAFSADRVYHKSDIEAIVRYAKYRGIRVIFELDAPAHAGHGWEWGEKNGLGKLAVCVDNQPWRKSCIQPNCGQLNPANNNVYSVLREIYSDISDYMEQGEYFHMGGDEVFIACWNQTEEIVDYMREKNYDRTTEGFLQLWSEFQKKALEEWDVTASGKKSVILWSSEMTLPNYIERYLPKERYIIQTWIPSDSDVPIQLLKKGYRIIISTKNAWYFDHGFWGNTKYYNWKTVYANMLPKSYLTLGGEVCMWGEYLDEFSIEVKIFPRLNAAAERLWSNPPTDFKTVESRFYRQRERLIAKGINADATQPEYCTLFEGECR